MSKLNENPMENDAELTRRISECNSGPEIQKVLAEYYNDQLVATGRVKRDDLNKDVLHEQPATAPRVAKTITVGGVTKVIEGANAEEVAAAELAYLRSIQPNTAQPRDEATGRFTAAEQGKIDEAAQLEIVRKSEVELKFKRGELSTKDYLLESGALQEALDAHAEKVQAEERGDKQLHAEWESASAEFLRSTPEWPGGIENLKLISSVLDEMGAGEYPDVENLRRAYRHLKDNNLLVENAEVTLQTKLANASTQQEIRDLLQMDERARSAQSSGGFFGGR
jgi:hypothetical protein